MKMLAGMKKRKGFTLIELIVVMAIIAILVLLAAPKYLNYTKDAHVTAMQQDAKVLQNIALAYNVKNDGIYPTATTLGADNKLGGLLTNLDDLTPIAATFAATKTANTVTLTKVNDALGLTGADVLVAGDVVKINKDQVASSLQGLKNDLTDYALVTKGTHEGEVVYIGKVLANSDGVKYVSVKPAVDQAKMDVVPV